jgi:hypothetical protein
MSVAITGSTVGTVALNSVNAQLYCESACLSSDESTVFWVGKSGWTQAGAVYKCPVSSFTTGSVTQVYAPGFLGTGSVAVWQVGTKIYSLESAGSSRILSANADGSSVSATVEWSSFQFASGAPVPVHVDATNVYAAMAGQVYVSRWDVGTQTRVQAYNMTWLACGIGPCRFQSNSFLIGQSQPGYVFIWDRGTGHLKSICGNGNSAALTAGGSAYEVSLDQPYFISSDEDGRVYFNSNNRLWSIINGTVSQVGATTNAFIMMHAFGINRLISGRGHDWLLIS